MKFIQISAWFFFIVLYVSTSRVDAYSNEDFQHEIRKMGYKEVQQALTESKAHYQRDVQLPLQIPSLAFSHSFGRFNDLQGEINDSLDVEYVNKDVPQNHYKMDIRPLKYKLSVPKETIDKTIVLENGKTAQVLNSKIISGFYVLIFDHRGWQYMLSMDKENANQLTISALIDIANSMK
ncbi:MAG: hypothetical protein ACQET8_21960 [Bacillota bacterium]|jgi:hypothetical protein